ncbi:hypothetical protein CO026_02995 [Candidatus Kaiserbacteria bacterium CG_4_9_14_0_2_um_filter_41_32]|uniref:ComEC/Rec2-related protein domain-containing protein n=1 Tax=Candidatus Kaiserbacteria bacterium CG_4_9_14_0_2_um_filter_41_32 TaxID=1974601 RepID=A0A2M8FED1_9BACT|nr:MAG: hypothetical protein CO026_02995 [Candidatus Kaiserbacteria bacterium CG_4_9_14_0_2_um_filter_41_32]
MSSVYFYTTILSFTSGIFARSFFNLGLPVVLWLLLLAFGLAMVRYRNSEAVSAPYLMVVGIGLMFFGLGILRLELTSLVTSPSKLETQLGQTVELTGVVVREPDVREKSQHLTLKVGDDKILVTTDRYATVSYGDEIVVKGKLEVPTAFATDLGRTFDYPGYLRARGILYTISFATFSIIDQNKASGFLDWLYQNKKNFTQVLEENIPEPHVGLGEGLLLGIKQALGTNLEEAFRRTGIIHIVVLSGYNVMLVVLFVMYILAIFLPLRIRAVIGVLAIILFALIVGLSATVVRASIMAVLVLVAQSTGRQYAVLRGLFLAGLVMLLLNPYLLVYDVGFQLSFMATLGLILVAPQFETLLVRVPTFAGVRGFLLATLATQIAVTPLLLYQMGQFSLVAVIVNVLVLPAVSLAMLLTFITGVLGSVSATLALPFAYSSYLILSYIISVATWFSSLSFATFTVSAFPFYFVPVAYGGIAFAFYWFYWRRSSISVVVLPGDISEWTIVPEFDVEKEVAVAKTNGGREQSSRPPTPTTDTVTPDADIPIFFR